MGWEVGREGPVTTGPIMGVRVGGPWTLVKVVTVLSGLRSAAGMVGILGIILGPADKDLGPGGLPGPGPPPLGDIFCLLLGLGWLGVLATGPVKPSLGPV